MAIVTFRPLRHCLLALLFAGFCSLATKADVVMTVDLSDFSAVQFNTTAVNSMGTFDDVDARLGGVTLVGFFDGNTDEIEEDLDSGTIDTLSSPMGSDRLALDSIFIGSFDGGFTPDDVNFYLHEADVNIYFRTDERALFGSAVHDLSSMNLTGLPATGATGLVYVGPITEGNTIGSYQGSS